MEQKGVSFLKFYIPKLSSSDVTAGIIFGSHIGIFARIPLNRKIKKGEEYQSLTWTANLQVRNLSNTDTDLMILVYLYILHI